MRRTAVLLGTLVLGAAIALLAAARTPVGAEDPEDVDIAGDLQLTQWAAHPMLANPVALAVDDRGRVYVTETARRKTSNLDIREHRGWMVDDLSFETVNDKRTFLRERLAPDRSGEHEWLDDRNGDGSRDWQDLTVQSEKIHRLEDTDGDGTADSSVVFADGFSTEVTGVAAGVLPADQEVYAAIAPDLWKLKDTDADGRSDERTSLADGFGVHFSYAGHDMSGLTRGPDGKIYWSIGDIGLNVTDDEGRHWAYPNQGAVMRANPDGSDFEVFAHGLRNPQELAFDKYGNLISVDNDGDRAGEHERIVYITEGSDAGWRMNWQFGKYSDEDNSDYVVWMEEGLHKPYFEGQPAYITPPVALYHDGPAGFAYNPGTALEEEYRDHFFVSLFTGSAAQARIHAFTLEQQGASFALNEDRQVMQGVLATGIAFSPAGALYLADWGEGWDTGPKGRIWKLDSPAGAQAELQRRTAHLLSEGMGDRPLAALQELLRHEDMRVRMEAQFELVRRGSEGEQVLREAARQTTHQLARLHGIWGIGQIGRENPQALDAVRPLLTAADPEVRAQVARVIGDAEYTEAAGELISLLEDPEPRPRFFAAIALGELGADEAFEPLVEMIARYGSEDPYLRQAGITGLTRLNDAASVAELHSHESKTVRLAAVVTLRRLRSERVRSFLNDPDQQVVTEAARAIHDDFSIPAALPDLAGLLAQDEITGEALVRRAINANLRIGAEETAGRLAAFAGRSSASALMRAEALASLAAWPNPSPLDRVTGRYRHLERRDTAVVRKAARGLVETIWNGAADTVQVEAAQMFARLQITAAGPHLAELVRDTSASVSARNAALRALADLEDERLADAVSAALGMEAGGVRQQAIQLMSNLAVPDEEKVAMYRKVLASGTTGQKQSAFEALGTLDAPAARQLLTTWMNRLLDGRVDRAVQLDVLQAARTAGSPALLDKVKQYEASKPETKLAEYRETLYGGSVSDGRQIVFEHSTAQCVRCHMIDGEGGTVGPPLGEFGAGTDREYILESLIDPGAALARGYGTTTFTLEDGTTVSGSVQMETQSFVIVEAGDGSTERVMKEAIEKQSTSPSAMPSMENILSKEQIRDVVAYLAQLK